MGDVYVAQHIIRDKELTKYSGHTGDITIDYIESKGGLAIEYIYAAAPTASNFNAAPVGSHLINTADGVEQVHNTTSTWKTYTVA